MITLTLEAENVADLLIQVAQLARGEPGFTLQSVSESRSPEVQDPSPGMVNYAPPAPAPEPAVQNEPEKPKRGRPKKAEPAPEAPAPAPAAEEDLTPPAFLQRTAAAPAPGAPPKEVSLEDLRAQLQKVMEAKGPEAVLALVKTFNQDTGAPCSRIKEIQIKDRPKAFADAAALIG